MGPSTQSKEDDNWKNKIDNKIWWYWLLKRKQVAINPVSKTIKVIKLGVMLVLTNILVKSFPIGLLIILVKKKIFSAGGLSILIYNSFSTNL